MRIEVLVDNQEPQIIPINRPKMTLGSNEDCDIFVKSTGISRKHLIIIQEDDKYYVVDQGSTNGSYINEERLVPGRKVEFTSFFPVRLGDNVLVSLLSDTDADELGYAKRLDVSKPNIKAPVFPSNSDSTRAISLKELQASNTENLIQKRQASVVKRKINARVPPKKKKDNSPLIKFLSFAILGGAIFYQFFLNTPEDAVRTVPQQTSPAIKKVTPEEAPKPVYTLVDANSILPKEKLLEMDQFTTCEIDMEKTLCEALAQDKAKVYQSGTMLYVLLEGDKYYLKAKGMMKQPVALADGVISLTTKKKYFEDRLLATMIFFIGENFPQGFNFETYKDLNFTFVLKIGQDLNDISTIAITGPSLKELKTRINSQNYDQFRKYGPEAFYFMKQFFIMDFKPVVKESLETQSAPVSVPENTAPSHP